MDFDRRKLMVNDAVNKMNFVQQAKSAAADPINRLIDTLANILVDVRVHVKPILQAGGGFDEPALKETVFKFLQEKLHTDLNRDEREVLLTILISEDVMKDIKSNPTGGDHPDLLAGL